ncbi:hypothetical protein B0T22DRAFT_478769 [Podospora appendiculata]|uniref:Uncharacterized protein n=1 Tax=Podospora appendiculata TaxID=314037 RepID=A0AAE0X861_9PEZI|nr:hypothetical protein B0T22DRAFT_478769 [Podospora appendiculata]
MARLSSRTWVPKITLPPPALRITSWPNFLAHPRGRGPLYTGCHQRDGFHCEHDSYLHGEVPVSSYWLWTWPDYLGHECGFEKPIVLYRPANASNDNYIFSCQRVVSPPIPVDLAQDPRRHSDGTAGLANGNREDVRGLPARPRQANRFPETNAVRASLPSYASQQNDFWVYHVWQMNLGHDKDKLYFSHETWMWRDVYSFPTSLECVMGRWLDFLQFSWVLQEAEELLIKRWRKRKALGLWAQNPSGEDEDGSGQKLGKKSGAERKRKGKARNKN